MRLRTLALATAVVAILLLALAGPGARLGLWHFGLGLRMVRWAAYAGMAGVVLALAALAALATGRPGGRPGRGRDRGVLVPLAALVLAGTAVLLPWQWSRQARAVPRIHDVTTDTQDPPAFVAVLPLRAGAPNAATYGGDSVAAQQRIGYPDIAPLRLAVPPGAAFERARAAAGAMGWELVAADSAAGRIEATATTRWFGFKDDVVVRIRPEGEGSRVDVRSVSRVGGSDVGTNATRVRAFLRRMQDA